MDDAARIAQLEAELAAALQRETAALEQQTALAEVLRVIAASPTDVQHVLDAIVQAAWRLCGADVAVIHRYIDGRLRSRAFTGAFREVFGSSDGPRSRPALAVSRASVTGRAFIDRVTVHVSDVDTLADEMPETYSHSRAAVRRCRAQISTPLVHGQGVLGVLSLFNFEPGSFSDEQIRLMETFADQAAIAIANASLFGELEQRNAELQDSNRQVTEALEQQTATAEVLRVIASTPT